MVKKLHGAASLLRSYQLSWSKKSAHFIEPEATLPCSQDPATGPCPELEKFRPHPHNLLIYNPFPSMLRSSKSFLPFSFSNQSSV